MKITERRLRSIIKSVIFESTLGNQTGGLADNAWVSWASNKMSSHRDTPAKVLADDLRSRGAVSHDLLANFIVQYHTPAEVDEILGMLVPYDQI